MHSHSDTPTKSNIINLTAGAHHCHGFTTHMPGTWWADDGSKRALPKFNHDAVGVLLRVFTDGSRDVMHEHSLMALLRIHLFMRSYNHYRDCFG